MKKLNTLLADIEKMLLRHPNTLCLQFNIVISIQGSLGL